MDPGPGTEQLAGTGSLAFRSLPGDPLVPSIATDRLKQIILMKTLVFSFRSLLIYLQTILDTIK